MRRILIPAILILLVACSGVSEQEARTIAYGRLMSLDSGPALQGEALLSGLTLDSNSDGTYLFTIKDRGTKLSWAVTVLPDGRSELSRAPFDEQD
jgi:hypothetical protein